VKKEIGGFEGLVWGKAARVASQKHWPMARVRELLSLLGKKVRIKKEGGRGGEGAC